MAKEEVVQETVDLEKGAIDIADFFTKESQENGVWCEPNIGGKIGVEFLVIGAESNEAAQIFADYDKDMNRINEIKDASTKNEETRKALATATSKLVKGMRSTSGKTLVMKGESFAFNYANAYMIMYSSPSIADRILRFARNDTNFMVKK